MNKTLLIAGTIGALALLSTPTEALSRPIRRIRVQDEAQLEVTMPSKFSVFSEEQGSQTAVNFLTSPGPSKGSIKHLLVTARSAPISFEEEELIYDEFETDQEQGTINAVYRPSKDKGKTTKIGTAKSPVQTPQKPSVIFLDEEEQGIFKNFFKKHDPIVNAASKKSSIYIPSKPGTMFLDEDEEQGVVNAVYRPAQNKGKTTNIGTAKSSFKTPTKPSVIFLDEDGEQGYIDVGAKSPPVSASKGSISI